MRNRAGIFVLLTAGAGAGQELHVGVVMRNVSGAPPAVVDAAEAECGRIFRAAGVKIAWINAAEDVDWQGPDVVMRGAILDKAPASRRAGVFGTALPERRDGTSLFLFYDRVVGLSRLTEAPVHLVLGVALAHEVGHVLLGSTEHSVTGLMQETWGRREFKEAAQGWLRFTPQQKTEFQSLRARVRRAGRAVETADRSAADRASHLP